MGASWRPFFLSCHQAAICRRQLFTDLYHNVHPLRQQMLLQFVPCYGEGLSSHLKPKGEVSMAKTQHISVRLSESDHRKLKDIARRLGVKESDLFRFIIKQSINRLLPFQDSDIRGSDLIPALMECGQELSRYLDLDSDQLDQIVNTGVLEQHKRVDRSDLDMLALAGTSDQYAVIKLASLTRQPIDRDNLWDVLKTYLTSKYLHACQLLETLKTESAAPPVAVNLNQPLNMKENHYA